MPTVEVVERLAAPVDDVWRLVCDVESYSKLMEPVRSVRILSEGPNWSVQAWEVVLKGSVLKWVERQERDPAAHHIAYHQLDGDLEVFDGFWRLRALGEVATEAILVVRFEIGVPMLRAMLDPVAERAIRQNSRAMLLSLGPAMSIVPPGAPQMHARAREDQLSEECSRMHLPPGSSRAWGPSPTPGRGDDVEESTA